MEGLVIRLKVDGVRFEMEIDEDGNYEIYGPIWRQRGSGQPFMTNGKLKAGILFPGLVKSVAELIRVKLKS